MSSFLNRIPVLTLVCLSTIPFALSVPAAVFSADPPVAVELTVQRVVPDGKGGETFESVEKVTPGDTIAYTIVSRNPGKKEVAAVKATLPVPPGTEYLPGTAEPAAFEASLDGKVFSPPPLTRRVKGADGKEEVREVAPSEYRSLRWDLKTLSSGQAVTVRARMKIQGGPR
jgi:uncharacterized repeat protein (TIGR01451 family)